MAHSGHLRKQKWRTKSLLFAARHSRYSPSDCGVLTRPHPASSSSPDDNSGAGFIICSSLPFLSSARFLEPFMVFKSIPLSQRRTQFSSETSCLREIIREIIRETNSRAFRKNCRTNRPNEVPRTVRQAQMMPKLASISVQTPRVMKLYVISCWFSKELDTAVVRRILVIVTLRVVSCNPRGLYGKR